MTITAGFIQFIIGVLLFAQCKLDRARCRQDAVPYVFFCRFFFNAICQKVPGQSKTDWISFGGHCYLFVRGETKTWENSRDDCIAEGAHLVKIDDKAENDFIDMNSGREMWIGLSKDSNGVFKWTDGTTPRYFCSQ